MDEKDRLQSEADSRIGQCPSQGGLHEPYTPTWQKEGRFYVMLIGEPGPAPFPRASIEVNLCRHCGLVYWEETVVRA